jgi:hypothetical protein
MAQLIPAHRQRFGRPPEIEQQHAILQPYEGARKSTLLRYGQKSKSLGYALHDTYEELCIRF